MILCPRCLQETVVTNEHKLQVRGVDGWNCTGKVVRDRDYTGRVICSNCNQTVNYEYSHKSFGEYTCKPPTENGMVSEGERRILNTIGNENTTDSLTHRLVKLQEQLNKFSEAVKKMPAPTPQTVDFQIINKMLIEVTEQRDAALAEVEFLKIKVEELEARRTEGCQSG